MTTPSAYPLAWPAHRPRRVDGWKNGRFTKGGQWLTNAGATKRVQDEVRRLGGINLLISSNVALRLDGLPRSGQGEPADRGVCVYFSLKGEPMAVACDRYTTVADNLAAIAAHLEATRAIERHGVATASESLRAFVALPSYAAPAARPWREVLGFPVAPFRPVTDQLTGRYRALAAQYHPDNLATGNADKMAELNVARDAALKELGA